MNRREATEISDGLFARGTTRHFINALREGIQVYTAYSQGTRVLGDWYSKNVESRALSSAVFFAFDEHDWDGTSFLVERYRETSSFRMRLRSDDLVVDLVRDRNRKSKFIKEQYKLNQPAVGEKPRCCLIDYTIDSETLELKRAELIIPKNRRSDFVRRSLLT